MCHPDRRVCVAKTSDQGTTPDRALADGSGSGDLGIKDIGVDQRTALGEACKAGSECESGYCVDGLCCDGACKGTCESCALSGTEGLCTDIASGQDPDQECMGTSPCGGDVCDGAGACTAFKPATTVCKSECSTTDTITVNQYLCDGQGACQTAPKAMSCSPYYCKTTSGVGACQNTCTIHSDCVKGSLCDRSEAHVAGYGKCIDTAAVAVCSNYPDIVDALAMINSGSGNITHLLLTTSFTNTLTLKKGPVFLVGDGKTTLKPPSSTSSTAIISVEGGAKVTLQGLILDGTTTIDNGVFCEGTSAKVGSLTIIESTLKGAAFAGVATDYCHLTLRRNTIQKNTCFGVSAGNGMKTIINNLVTDNGVSTGGTQCLSYPTGVYLYKTDSSIPDTVTFSHNTIVKNLSIAPDKSQVVCFQVGISAAPTLRNSIFWTTLSSLSVAPISGCNYLDSVVQGGTGATVINSDPLLSTSYVPGPKSPCIDAAVAPSGTVLDILGKPRPAIVGGKADLGAFEVK